MKKILGLVLVAILVASMVVFAATAEEGSGFKVGFSLPTMQEERWSKTENFMNKVFEEKFPNSELIVQMANGSSDTQYSQIENLITQGIDALIVAPVDVSSLGPVCDRCHEEGILVIAYTRCPESCWVDAYFDYDLYSCGVAQASSALEAAPEGNYVLLGGDSNHNGVPVIRQGWTDVLQESIDSGAINVILDQNCAGWDPSVAMANMENALAMSGNDIAAVVVMNDTMAGGVVEALDTQGLAGKVYVTGQDGDKAAIKRIIEGTQMMTNLQNIITETEVVAEMCFDLLEGREFEFSGVYNNGLMDINTIYVPTTKIVKDNIQSVLIDTGYYTMDDLT